MSVLKGMPDSMVDCCVTSPPYWGLRKYGDWEMVTLWGAENLDDFTMPRKPKKRKGWLIRKKIQATMKGIVWDRQKKVHLCAYGLEPTPELYVEHTATIFAEVKRVLAPHGTLWLNLGDSYNAGRDGGHAGGKKGSGFQQVDDRYQQRTGVNAPGLKPKDLCGIPWAVAKALQAPYYTGKIKNEQDRIWMAAMMDGEGSICGTEYETNGRQKTNIYITVTNSDKGIIANCERIFPQIVKHVYRKKHAVNIEVKKLFIREIYPHLIAKKKQAIIAWNFLLLQSGLPSKKKGYLPEQKEKRHWLMKTLSALNHGNEIVLPNWLVEPPSLFEPGFYLRQDIVWKKPNPMPESCRDRCTKAHEYLFLLSKQPRYYYDQEAIKEPSEYPDDDRKGRAGMYHRQPDGSMNYIREGSAIFPTRNRRSVWTIPTQPYSEAHFATYPEKLVEPCIKAGCPKEVCVACGKPRERILNKTQTTDGRPQIGPREGTP